MHYKKREWNEEIDPAFNKIIRNYLDGLKSIEIPSNEGYLVPCPSEDQLKKLESEGFPTLAKYYERKGKEDFVDIAGMVFSDDLGVCDYKKIRRKAKKKGYALQSLLSLPEFIKDEESRKYYSESFAPLESDAQYKAYVSSLSEKTLKKWNRKLKSDGFSLFLHVLTLAVETLKGDARRMEVFKQRNIYNSKLLRQYLFLIWDVISIMNHKMSIRELLKEAREGNDESLLKLIQLDKTLFDHEWVG